MGVLGRCCCASTLEYQALQDTEVRLGRWLEVPGLNLTSTVSLSRHQACIMRPCLFFLVNGNIHSSWSFALKIRREFASIVPATQFLQSCTRVCEKSMTGGRESMDTTYRPRALQQASTHVQRRCGRTLPRLSNISHVSSIVRNEMACSLNGNDDITISCFVHGCSD